jgi:hypothetical protein
VQALCAESERQISAVVDAEDLRISPSGARQALAHAQSVANAPIAITQLNGYGTRSARFAKLLRSLNDSSFVAQARVGYRDQSR